MRTNIDIDEKLLQQAMKTLKVKTKEEAVEEALRLVARRQAADTLRKLRGKVQMYRDPEGTNIVRK